MITAGSPITASEARSRIAALSHLNAFISVSEEDGQGPAVAVKDLVDVAGMVTTGGGRLLPERPAAHDAPVVRRIRRCGCVVVGKTNLHEWAYGSTSVNPHYGPVRHPVDPARIAGGSSGGSAVAVACGMCEWAIGTDTAGSLRIPASLCGVVSIKPTYGTISTAGVIPLSRSLDTVGPMARDVSTAAAALAIMTLRPPPIVSAPDLRTLRVGRAPTGWVEGLDAETAFAWEAVASGFPEIDIPDRLRASGVCTTISMYEASRFHRRWLESSPERYGDEDVRSRLELGLGISPDEYESAMREKGTLTRAMSAAMKDWDALLAPATAMVAPAIDGPDVREPMTRFTRPFAATGQPVVTIPAPTPGLPVGIQVVGKPHGDQAAIAVAAALEAQWR
jgi:aspartyl-tRNA(Asn)/glutamyl-tRNA(Gln) amidotransferase subunit A